MQPNKTVDAEHNKCTAFATQVVRVVTLNNIGTSSKMSSGLNTFQCYFTVARTHYVLVKFSIYGIWSKFCGEESKASSIVQVLFGTFTR